MREPRGHEAEQSPQSWKSYYNQLLEVSRRLKTLIRIELLTGFSLMALPFYVVNAREKLDAPAEAVGWFLLAQVLGGVLGNLVWARLVDLAGSRKMLVYCAVISALTPLLAIALAPLG